MVLFRRDVLDPILFRLQPNVELLYGLLGLHTPAEDGCRRQQKNGWKAQRGHVEKVFRGKSEQLSYYPPPVFFRRGGGNLFLFTTVYVALEYNKVFHIPMPAKVIRRSSDFLCGNIMRKSRGSMHGRQSSKCLLGKVCLELVVDYLGSGQRLPTAAKCL